MGNLEGRLKKLEAKLSATEGRREAIVMTVFPLAGEYQRVRSIDNNNIVILRKEGETEDQFFDRAESEIRALTGQAVVAMIADGWED
jgi:hypothetical protein